MHLFYQASNGILKKINKFSRLTQACIKLGNVTSQKRYHRPGIFDDEEDGSHDFNNKDNFSSPLDTNESKYSKNQRNNKFGYGRDNRVNFKQRNFSDTSYGKSKSFGMPSRYSFEYNRSSLGNNLPKPIFNLEDYPSIEKNFYVEHENIIERTLEEVEKFRQTNRIHVVGTNIPKPIISFDELHLPGSLIEVLKRHNYSDPTSIQSQGWPIVLSGRDIIGISQTGSGKTLVFMLPAIIHAKNQDYHPKKNECKPQVLVLAPTRELVQQIHQVSYEFIHACGLISGCAYGGASKVFQLQSLRGANICIATPGRLIDFVSEGQINLELCTYLVLDEADRMLDMGFEPQIRKIIEQIRPDRQTLMWSATWPKDIQNLAEDFLSDYIKVTIGSDELVANPNIEQNFYVMKEEEKDEKLLSLLEKLVNKERSKVLVFAQTKRKVDYLDFNLNKTGMPALAIHGDVSQSRRDRIIRQFRKEKSCVLIATDVAARGLDITDIHHVINYDFPTNIEDYIHRIGRTARGENFGISHSFFTSENIGLAKELILLLKNANQSINPEIYSLMDQNKKSDNYFSRHRRFQRRNYSF